MKYYTMMMRPGSRMQLDLDADNARGTSSIRGGRERDYVWAQGSRVKTQIQNRGLVLCRLTGPTGREHTSNSSYLVFIYRTIEAVGSLTLASPRLRHKGPGTIKGQTLSWV